MKISLIAALAENNAIGYNNDLLWHLPADMRFFKEKTIHHHVLTGRKNYESIPEKYRPLVSRTNLVVTTQKNYRAPGALVFDSIAAAIEHAKKAGEEELFVIGGGEIYRQTMHLAHQLYLTKVHHTFTADTFFPEIDKETWLLETEVPYQADDRNPYAMSFCTYSRKKQHE
jgi:dihydrofolate reductase